MEGLIGRAVLSVSVVYKCLGFCLLSYTLFIYLYDLFIFMK